MASMRLPPILGINAPTRLWPIPVQMRKRAGQRDERYGIGVVEAGEEEEDEERKDVVVVE